MYIDVKSICISTRSKCLALLRLRNHPEQGQLLWRRHLDLPAPVYHSWCKSDTFGLAVLMCVAWRSMRWLDIAVSLRSTVSQSALHCQFCDSCCRNRSVCFGVDVSLPTQAPKIEKVFFKKNKKKHADFCCCLFLFVCRSWLFPPLVFFI